MRWYLDSIHPSWKPLLYLLSEEFLLDFKDNVLQNERFYPEPELIFKVFSMPLSDIKIVILGTEPYQLVNVNTGLAFAVKQSVSTLPPKLKTLQKSLGKTVDNVKTLENWESQGVFLLNTSLTIGVDKTHKEYWKNFIKKVVYFIGYYNPCIWFLWGDSAKNYISNLPRKSIFKVQGYDDTLINEIPINSSYNYIFSSVSPSLEYITNKGLFEGNLHFKQSNVILSKLNKKQIDWEKAEY